MWSRNTELSQPGEYGGKHQPSGWVVITLPELSNQTIYLASEEFAYKLAQKHKIPTANIVQLNHPASQQKRGIPEEKLDGKDGLQLFNQRLRAINRRKNPVIIHCKRGINRTPVAAVLYLISQHIDPQRAVDIVTTAYRQWRDPDFVLDKRGHYEHVLAEVGVIKQSNLSKYRHVK